jgi:transposase InsO family protein
MDFMADELFDGRRFRLLTIVDDFTRESLAVEIGQHLTGGHVAEVLDRLNQPLPDRIRVDNGTEFSVRGEAVLEMRVGLSQPGIRTWLQTSLSCGGQESSW